MKVRYVILSLVWILPGPDKHRWSSDLPAYEFPTGDPDARVVARKNRKRDEWLVTAWAAGGPDRRETVEIPFFGKNTVQARATGSVYPVAPSKSGPVATLLDVDGMNPSAKLPTGFGKAPQTKRWMAFAPVAELII
jgi:hypothetical protein